MYPDGQKEPQQTPETAQGYSPYTQPAAAPGQNQSPSQNPWVNNQAQTPSQNFDQPSNPYQPLAQPATRPVQPAQPTAPAYSVDPQQQQQYYSNPTPRQYNNPVATTSPQPQPAPNVDYMGGPSESDQQEYSIDYLNKIAPKEQKVVNKFAMFGLIGAGVFIAIFAFIIMINPSKTPNVKTQTITLSERIATLEATTEKQQTLLNEEEIYSANTALNASLESMNAKLTTSMKTAKIKEDKKQKAAEETYAAKLNKTLDDAYQRGTLDRTYTAQMTYELSILRSRLVAFGKSNVSSEFKEMSANGVKDIDTVLKTLSEFSATKS